MLVANTAIEAFYQLILDGKRLVGVDLDQDIEAFMVYALLRNMNKMDLKEVIFAQSLLTGISQQNIDQLENVLDSALIYAGWYPKRAQRLGVSPAYFSDIGKMASLELSHYYYLIKSSYQTTYAKISVEFDKLVMVLQAFFTSREIHRLHQAGFVVVNNKNH